MKKINNNIKPTNSINNTKTSKKNPVIFIDFVEYPNWTHSVRVGDYTNQLKDEKECSKQFYKLINKLLPYIQKQGKKLFNRPDHCHIIQQEKRTLSCKVIKELHGFDLPEETDLWQLSYGEGTRLVCAVISGNSDEDSIIVYPLFIDHHHLIYPSKNKNKQDYGRNALKFCPQKKYT